MEQRTQGARKHRVVCAKAGPAFFIFLTVSVSGCGDKFQRGELGFTEVRFTHVAAQAFNLAESWLGEPSIQAFSANGIIHAINQEQPDVRGRKYIASMGAGATLNWFLPNGTWKFYVTGYDLPNAGVTPSSIGACGTSAPVSLNGGSQMVSVPTSNATCGGPPFATAALSDFKVFFCNASTLITSGTGTTTSCAGLSGGAVSTSVHSAFLAIYEQDEFSGIDYRVDTSRPGIRSACLPVGVTSGSVPFMTSGVGSFLRMGNPGSFPSAFFRSELITFSDTSCGTFYKSYVFRGGMAAAGTSPGFPAAMSVDVSSAQADESSNAHWALTSSSGQLFIKD